MKETMAMKEAKENKKPKITSKGIVEIIQDNVVNYKDTPGDLKQRIHDLEQRIYNLEEENTKLLGELITAKGLLSACASIVDEYKDIFDN